MSESSPNASLKTRREPTVILIVAAFVLVLLGSFLAFRTAPDRTDSTDEQVLSGVVRRVVIDVDTGAVTVSGSVRSGATVTRSIRKLLRSPETSALLENGVLMIRSHCGLPAFGCNVDHEIEVPATASLEITTDRGDIEVRNFASSSRLTSSSGSIIVERMAGESLEIHTVSGSLKANALAMDTLVARTDAGSIDASFKSIPTAVDAASSAGALDLAVPSGAYKLSLSSSSGKVTVTGIDDDQSAPRSITARSEAGRVRVTGL